MEAPVTLSPSFPSTNPSEGPSTVHSPVIYKITADTSPRRDDFAGDEVEVEVVTYDGSHEKGGLFSGFVNLLTGAIGVGILSFPFAFKSAGLVGISVLSVAFALLNAYTLWLLARYAQRHAAHLGSTPTYEVLVRRVLGKRAYVVVVCCILFNTIGALSAFLIVVGDLGHTVLHEWLQDSSVPPFFYSKAFVVLVFCFGVALPLSLFPNMHDLWFSSFLAVASVFVVAGMVIGRGVEACVNGRMDNGLTQAEGVEVFNLQLEFFLAVPLVVFSLGCHLQVVPVYHSLKRRKKPWMGTILASSVATCVIVYLATGLMGYLRFGDDSQGDILSNFPVDDIMLDVGKLLMAAHISLAYPVNLYPCTKTVQLLLTFIPPAWARFKRALTDDRDEYEAEEDEYEYENSGKGKHVGDADDVTSDTSDTSAKAPSRLWTFVSHWLITLCMLGVTATLAILLPNIQVVFGLVGSTTAVVLNFVTPALMLLVCPLSLDYDDTALLGINEEEDEAITRSYASYSSLLASSSTTTTTPLLRPPPSRNLCASAVVERVLAMGIISLALLIAICGTGVNIYQNFL